MTVTETPAPFAHPGLAGPTAAVAEALTAPADRTLTADVLAELSAGVTPKMVTLLVPDREGYSVDFDCRLDADLLKGYTKVASADGETDIFLMSLLVIAGQCRGIRRHGVLLEVGGKPIDFTSPQLADAYGSLDVSVTVRSFYRDDNAVAATFGRIQEEARAGSLDPTPESSS